MKGLVAVGKRFDNWWFGWHSPASLGLLRIMLGTLAFVSLALTLFVFNDFYAPDGYSPNPMIEGWLNYRSDTVFHDTPLEFKLPFGMPRLSFLMGNPSYGLTLTVFLITMLAAATFAIGFYTRVSGFVLVAGLVSIHTRNPLMIHSGDTLMRLCIVYLAFSPAGAMYSIDAWRKWKRLGPEAGAAPHLVRVTGQRLIAFQVAIVYLYTVWWKMFGTYWLDGTATWYPAKMHEFMRFPMPEIFERQPFLALQTYGTLVAEVALGTLVFWKPTRKFALICGLLMHAYIEFRFNIPMFAIIITSCYVAFYDGEEVKAWVDRVTARWRNRNATSVEPETASS